MAPRPEMREAHREQKILMASAAEEVSRIAGEGGFQRPSALAVLRLGGAQLGGYGEGDIAYSFRQLSRVLHPDKNPDLAQADQAFHRLSEEQRRLVIWFASATSQQVPDSVMERPQEPLFAEACRLLTVICGLAGEGLVTIVARGRALSLFTSTYQGCRAPELLGLWFDRPQLLEAMASPSMRIAYDCAAKRYRAQFLCLLSRAEVKRTGALPRDGWKKIAETFPELVFHAHLEDLREQIYQRCWMVGADDPPGMAGIDRSRSPARALRSRWARKWRKAMAAILPSGEDTAAPAADPEVKKLAHVMWKDIVAVAEREPHGSGPKRALGALAATEWCFIPSSDIFLVVGEDLIGMTLEGLFADNAPGQKRIDIGRGRRSHMSTRQAERRKRDSPAPKAAAVNQARPSNGQVLQVVEDVVEVSPEEEPKVSEPTLPLSDWELEAAWNELQNRRLPNMEACRWIVSSVIKLYSKENGLHCCSQEQNVVFVPKPEAGARIIVVGDLHGHFSDFIHILTEHGEPQPGAGGVKYIFNGDFVDRGAWGPEVLLSVYLLKIRCPDGIFLNRGNHEDGALK
eukprot:g29913.t1